MYFSPIVIVYDIRRLAVEYARTCVSGVLSFIPINDLAACCCWRRWSFLPRDSRWADGRIFSAFQIFTNRLYTHRFLFCFVFLMKHLFLLSCLPAHSSGPTTIQPKKRITLIYIRRWISVFTASGRLLYIGSFLKKSLILLTTVHTSSDVIFGRQQVISIENIIFFIFIWFQNI